MPAFQIRSVVALLLIAVVACTSPQLERACCVLPG